MMERFQSAAYRPGSPPFESFTLTNETARIRTAKNRIKELEDYNARHTKTISYIPEGLPEITVTHDVIENRLKITPPPKDKSFALGLNKIFRQYGFVWSPTNKCYQRKLLNSMYSEKVVLAAIREAYKKNVKE